MDDYPYDLGPYTRKITTASSVAPARSMLVAAEWRRRLAPRDGASMMPARLSCISFD